MRVAFILSNAVSVSTDGVLSQGLTWKKCLELKGYSVDLVNMWEKRDWRSYDAIVFFGFSTYMCDFLNFLHPLNPNIVIAPILDPNYSMWALKTYTHWGCKKLRLTNPFHSLRQAKDMIKLFLVRSEYEKKYIVNGFGVEEDRCIIIPLSLGLDLEALPNPVPKEPFCFHMSLLTDERKNVYRLIQAAKKYQFKLVLAGVIRSDKARSEFMSWIDGCQNIEYRGYISEEEKLDLYNRAKVFALPSLNEGVGIVALDAAVMGCEIVLTNLGGPKEYYNGMAKLIDPYNVDSIGLAINDALNSDLQITLKEYIANKYSLNSISNILSSTLANL